MPHPTVSTVIPTTRRPDLVIRAVRSVFAQTFSDYEIIVVVDGPNPETMEALLALEDNRLKIVQNEVPSGPGAARNKGAAMARGEWVAFLDDDDEWLPTKLDRQLTAARSFSGSIVISCLSNIVSPSAKYVWPRLIYDNNIPLDEYLFDRRSFFKGEAFLPTPSLMMPRNLFNAFQFPSIQHHEDWDLLLRLSKIGRAQIVTVAEPLVVIYYEENRASLSDSSTWRSSLNWIEENRPLVGPRAYSGFCLTIAAPEAARAANYLAFPELLGRAFRHGQPGFFQLAFFFAIWIFPMNFRRMLRAKVFAAAAAIRLPPRQ